MSGAEEDIAAYRHVMGIVEHFAATWRELMIEMPDTYNCTYTCAEANAAVELYLALGDTTAARAILSAHAAYDDGGDQHYDPASEAPGTRPG